MALQLIPAWTLFIGMFFFPFSPRWLMLKHREEEAIASLCKLRRLDANDPLLRAEFLEIKAAVMFDEETQAEQIGTGGSQGQPRGSRVYALGEENKVMAPGLYYNTKHRN
ncbi:MFS transporter [Bacillus velezensis]|uniref:MFS transporter n=1 Tax=Bacillus velezensis TaxID=492670 RepID=UPI0023E30155|nr:MFS transporter [Bacillus velezensis]WES02017.1 MFS transporter [Bacillus velezensis]